MWAILFSTNTLLIYNTAFAVTTLSEPERTRMCPGQTINYTCTTSRVPSITWAFYCPDTDIQDLPRPTVSIANSSETINETLLCTSDGVHRVTVAYTITFKMKPNETQSNISITVLETNSTSQRLAIDCEDSGNYRILNLEALPPSPNDTLTYSIEQENCNLSHVPTTLSWPQQDEESSLLYLLSIAEMGINATADVATFRLRQPNISLQLKYNAMYTMTLRASRCEFQLNSSGSVTTVIQLPAYKEPLHPELNITEVSPGVLSYQCREGLVPEGTVISVCGRDGTWIPPPSQYNCTLPEIAPTSTGSNLLTNGEGSGNTTVLILAGCVAGVILLLLFSIVAGSTVILICLKIHLNSKAKSEAHGPGVPVYEEISIVEPKGDIELKENVAYGTSTRP